MEIGLIRRNFDNNNDNDNNNNNNNNEEFIRDQKLKAKINKILIGEKELFAVGESSIVTVYTNIDPYLARSDRLRGQFGKITNETDHFNRNVAKICIFYPTLEIKFYIINLNNLKLYRKFIITRNNNNNNNNNNINNINNNVNNDENHFICGFFSLFFILF